MTGVVVVISGRGSNLRAILEAGIPVTAVIANNPGVAGLEIASAFGVETRVIDHRGFPGRPEFDTALREAIDRFSPAGVALAGFMRILTNGFVEHFRGRLLNIHPSLLPAFSGLDTHVRALAAGVKVHGCTVHFVAPELDAGPIVVQAAVPVRDDDTPSTLAARVLSQEHRVYPQALRWLLEGRLALADGRVRLRGARIEEHALISPTLEP